MPPEGLRYAEELVTPAEERALVALAAGLSYEPVVMHGVAAKRTVVHFGWSYGFQSIRIEPVEPIPPPLLPIRERCAALAGRDPAAFTQALVIRYPPGAGIGWHRDARMFGPEVLGVSLLSPCRMRFRRGRVRAWETAELELAPRSAYVLAGPARSEWEHAIPDTKALRYSITFRSVLDEARWRAEAEEKHDRAFPR